MTHSTAGHPEDSTSTHPDLEGQLILLSSPHQQTRIIASEAVTTVTYVA
jgi:hypothetical protein